MWAGSRRDTGGRSRLLHTLCGDLGRAEFTDRPGQLDLVAIQRPLAGDCDRGSPGINVLGPGNVVAFDLAIRDGTFAERRAGFAGKFVAVGLDVPGGGDGITLGFIRGGPLAV